MTVGYAAFQTNLDIKGTSKVSSNWNVLITNVTESNKEGQAETVGSPTWTDLTAYMEANLYQKGDYVEYEVTVENRGTLDAKLESITDNIKSTNEAIKISFTGYTKGEKLYKNETKIIKVKIEYNPEFNGTIEEGSSEVSIDLNYNQSEGGGTVTPTDKYLVTYDCTTNGGNNCTSYNEYLNEGDTVNLNYRSEKEGYEFLGWSTNKDATEGLTELTMPASDITLYAIYKDTVPPECDFTVSEATTDNVTFSIDCTDKTEIKEYIVTSDNIDSTMTVNAKEVHDKYLIYNYNLSKVSLTVKDTLNNTKTYKLSDKKLQEGYQLIYDVLNKEYIDINNQTQTYEEEILNKLYPIGSVYITETNTNPSETLGGVWERYGKGRTLVGVDPNDTNFNSVNKTGGNKTSTLAITNLPSHTHSIPTLSGTAASTGAHMHNFLYVSSPIAITYGAGTIRTLEIKPVSWVQADSASGNNLKTTSKGNHTHTITTTASNTENIGNGTSFTNLQPYITVYMYKRIS